MNSPALFATGTGAFNPAEMKTIIAYGDRQELIKGTLGNAKPDERYESRRITRLAAIGHSDETLWIYERLLRVVNVLNQRFQYKLGSFAELIQYMVYNADEGSHFAWHADTGPTVNRKLSLTIQLTDPAEYQGCELQFQHGDKVGTAPKQQGMLIAFPSSAMHRVTPITAGTRRALVAWIPEAR